MKDYTGYKLGHLLVLSKIGENKAKQGLWLCKCDCGNTITLRDVTIEKGNITTCCNRCCYRNNLIGKRFSYLTVIDVAGINKNGKRNWVCKCDCGNVVTKVGSSLISGNTKSCGCKKNSMVSQQKTKHKHYGEKIYIIWIAMKGRCYNKKNISYKDYGERGIQVCDEWKNDFMAFYEWANKNGYIEGLSIDRVDFNGNYCPDNCRWVSKEFQQSNKRNNKYITYQGKTMTIPQWSRYLGVPYERLRGRLDRGWSIEDAFFKEKISNSKK